MDGPRLDLSGLVAVCLLLALLAALGAGLFAQWLFHRWVSLSDRVFRDDPVRHRR